MLKKNVLDSSIQQILVEYRTIYQPRLGASSDHFSPFLPRGYGSPLSPTSFHSVDLHIALSQLNQILTFCYTYFLYCKKIKHWPWLSGSADRPIHQKTAYLIFVWSMYESNPHGVKKPLGHCL